MNHILPNLTLPTLGPLEAVLMALIIQHGLIDLLLGIQHKRPVLHDLLIQRQSRDEYELPRLFRILRHLCGHSVAFLLKDNIVVLAHGRLFFADAKGGRTGERIGEGVPADGEGLGDFPTRSDCDVEDPDGRVGELLDAVRAVRLARDDLDRHVAVVDLDGGDLRRSEVAVSRLARLQFLRQVDPQLHSHIRAPVGVLSGHLGVHDTAPRGHELEVSGFNRARVAGKILVIHCPLEQVCDGLLPTMRMVWEAGAWCDGEVVEHEKWREVSQL